MQIVVSLSVSPRRNMEADDDVDTDYRKYYATWCHAMIPHPQNILTRWRRSWPETRIRGLHVQCTCAQRVTSSPTVSSCIFREHDIVSGFFFYNQADVISESIKEPWQTKVVWMHWYFSKDVSERSEKENWIHHSFYCTLTAGLIAGNCNLWLQIQ